MSKKINEMDEVKKIEIADTIQKHYRRVSLKMDRLQMLHVLSTLLTLVFAMSVAWFVFGGFDSHSLGNAFLFSFVSTVVIMLISKYTFIHKIKNVKKVLFVVVVFAFLLPYSYYNVDTQTIKMIIGNVFFASLITAALINVEVRKLSKEMMDIDDNIISDVVNNPLVCKPEDVVKIVEDLQEYLNVGK